MFADEVHARDSLRAVSFDAMKVLDGLSGGIEPGAPVSIAELGLPASGTGGVLLVFWKST